jgi:hypothetical protein
MSFTEILEEVDHLNSKELTILFDKVRSARYDEWAEEMNAEAEEAIRALHAGELKGGTAEEVIAHLNQSLDEDE